MASADGYVCKFEATDEGGCGTRWNFFIGGQPVLTRNAGIADSIRLAIETASQVHVEYDAASQMVTQVQIVFRYICQSTDVKPCEPVHPPGTICDTRRYSSCNDDRAHKCDDIQ